MGWSIVLSALALVLVIEGAMPFLSPVLWRRVMLRLFSRSDTALRIIGFISLIVGAILMYLVHSGAVCTY